MLYTCNQYNVVNQLYFSEEKVLAEGSPWVTEPILTARQKNSLIGQAGVIRLLTDLVEWRPPRWGELA